MSNIPINLKYGLDLTSSVLSKRPGSLIDCMNYEFTASDGLSRLEGYERYDGWANGGLSDVWQVAISISDAAAFSAAVVGGVVKLITAQGIINVGVYVSSTSTTINYLPITKYQAVIRSGDAIIVDSGSTADATATAKSFALYTTLSTANYLATVRSTAASLRSAVVDSPTPVCGLHWFRNTLLEARDAPMYTITGIAASFFNVGETISIGTIKGLIIHKETSPTRIWIEPYVSGTVSTSIAVLNKDGTTASSATATTVTESLEESDWAYMVALGTPDTDAARSVKRMNRAVIVEFTGGTQAAGADPVEGLVVNVGPDSVTNYYYLSIKSIVLTSGSWAAGTAAGRMELVPHYSLDATSKSGAGAYNKIVVGDVVRNGGNSFFTVSSVIRTEIAGTNRLRIYNSHYVGFTANFFGEESQAEAYLTTGASRAIWAKYYNKPLTGYRVPNGVGSLGEEVFYSYGNIYVTSASILDVPKFCSRHARLCLALGYEGGSTAISVVNEPYNMSGIDGAQSLPMGDEITGMLEGVGDSTIVFGRRSISRLAGIADGIKTYTISPDSGALPYTCVNVKRIPMFADQNGVSMLTQSETYSDFIGERASDSVQLKLKPRLVTSVFDTEIGGAHCAFQVRSKNQYRLVLRSGTIYTFCMTGEEPLITISNYSNDSCPRVPIAWSSQIQDNGKERLHVVWDEFYSKYSPDDIGGSYSPITNQRVYELDAGWGFDGETFDCSFETSPLFNDGTQNFIAIDRLRVFGRSHGVGSLVVRARGIERDFDQELTTASQDISLPAYAPANFYKEKRDVTSFTDHANWGLGVSLVFSSGVQKGLTNTEPSHVIQIIVIQPRIEGVTDA